MRIFTCFVALGVISTIFLETQTPGADLNDVKRALDGLRSKAGFKRMKLETTTRYPKGSLNLLRSRGSTNDLPPKDVAVTAEIEKILDFTSQRTWSRGSYVQSRVDKDEQGVESVMVYLEFAENAFDGSTLTSLKPKERQDPRVLPADGLVPAEFRFMPVPDPANTTVINPIENPIYISEGALPAAEQLTVHETLDPLNKLPAFKVESWRIKNSNARTMTIVSAPLASGTHDEYTLDPSLSFLPIRWVRYSKATPLISANLHYRTEDARPELSGWELIRYDSPGIISCEYTVKISETSRPSSIPDTQFRLQPATGVIVLDMQPGRTTYRLAGSDAMETESLADINRVLTQSKRDRTIILGGIGLFVLVAVGILIYRLRMAKGS